MADKSSSVDRQPFAQMLPAPTQKRQYATQPSCLLVSSDSFTDDETNITFTALISNDIDSSGDDAA